MMEKILQELRRLNDKIDWLGKKINSTWLDIKQTSNYLHISESSLRKHISKGEIPVRRIGHGSKSKILVNRRMLDLSILYGKTSHFTKAEKMKAEGLYEYFNETQKTY